MVITGHTCRTNGYIHGNSYRVATNQAVGGWSRDRPRAQVHEREHRSQVGWSRSLIVFLLYTHSHIEANLRKLISILDVIFLWKSINESINCQKWFCSCRLVIIWLLVRAIYQFMVFGRVMTSRRWRHSDHVTRVRTNQRGECMVWMTRCDVAVGEMKWRKTERFLTREKEKWPEKREMQMNTENGLCKMRRNNYNNSGYIKYRIKRRNSPKQSENNDGWNATSMTHMEPTRRENGGNFRWKTRQTDKESKKIGFFRTSAQKLNDFWADEKEKMRRVG